MNEHDIELARSRASKSIGTELLRLLCFDEENAKVPVMQSGELYREICNRRSITFHDRSANTVRDLIAFGLCVQ